MNTSKATGGATRAATKDGTDAPPAAGVSKPVARVKVGERLNHLFEETTRPDGKRWTITHVSDELRARGQDVSRQYLGYLMTGERDEPRLSLVEALADVFDVPVAYFTNDYLGRVTTDLLPLLSVMTDPTTRGVVTRPDLAEVAAALADPRVAEFLTRHPLPDVLATLAAPSTQSAVEDTLAQMVAYGIIQR